MKRLELQGKRFGKLLVLERAGSNKQSLATWKCRCDCGKEKVIKSGSLRSGDSKSCGCLHTEVRRKKMAETNKRADMRERKRVFQTGRPLSDVAKKKVSDFQRSHRKLGSDNPAWKGGITPISFAIRNSTDYADWRMGVFRRDGFRCTTCGTVNKVGNNICAHHIRSFKDFPELRMDVDNGTTLCKECHLKFHADERRGTKRKAS